VVWKESIEVLTDDAIARYGAAHPVIIAGDFNTHNHGVSRLINRQCGDDPYRWKALGMGN
jgi:endonuclease/exonuclease/phosphatase family metal-dependent hydrolase